MAKKHNVDADHIRRQAKLDRQHDAGHHDVRQSFVKESNVAAEAERLADSPRGPVGTTSAHSALPR